MKTIIKEDTVIETEKVIVIDNGYYGNIYGSLYFCVTDKGIITLSLGDDPAIRVSPDINKTDEILVSTSRPCTQSQFKTAFKKATTAIGKAVSEAIVPDSETIENGEKESLVNAPEIGNCPSPFTSDGFFKLTDKIADDYRKTHGIKPE